MPKISNEARANSGLARTARALQARLEIALGRLPNSAPELYDEICAVLSAAIRGGRLQNPPYEIKKLVKLIPVSEDEHQIVGGPKDFNRLQSGDSVADRLHRDDGAILHFSLTTRQLGDRLAVLAYDFELYQPSGAPLWFIRFDLNPILHANSDDGLRSHFHPASDDISLPAPWLTPCEALTLLLHGVRPGRAAPRS